MGLKPPKAVYEPPNPPLNQRIGLVADWVSQNRYRFTRFVGNLCGGDVKKVKFLVLKH
ncbi:MAG: hypothetical protein ACI9XJ_001411 [Marivirga sp.]